MASRPFTTALLVTLTAAALLAGCCPSGVDVLESLTLPAEQQGECRLATPAQVADGPLAPMPANPIATSDSRSVAAIAPEVTGASSEGVRSAYAAAYECEPGGPMVRVYAVLFSSPSGPDRIAALEANPAGVMHKGQLAGVVVPDEDACEECYEAAMARAERVFGK